MSTLIFIHGAGGPTSVDKWTAPLDARLKELDHPPVCKWADQVIAPSYFPLLRSGASIKSPPRATFARLDDHELAVAHADYALRRKALERAVLAMGEPSGVSGIGFVPRSVQGPIARATEFVRFPEVRTWMSNTRAQDEARATLLAAVPTSGEVIIVAHSLGSVVAAGLLYYLPADVTVELLVTIGSPLSIRRYADSVKKICDDFPYGRVLRWINLYGPQDGVTGGKRVARYFPSALDVATSIGWAHDRDGYMSHPVVAAAIASVLIPPTRSSSTNLPSRRLHLHWRRLLLGAAFAQTVAQRLPPEQWSLKIRVDGARREAAIRETNEITIHAEQRGALLAAATERGMTIDTAQRDDHPLSPGRFPTVDDLVDHADDHLEFSWSFDELLPFAVGLLIQPLARPFDTDVDMKRRVDALEHLIYRVRDRSTALRRKSDSDLAKQVVRSGEWASKRMEGDKKFPTGRVLLASSVLLLGATGIGLAVAAPAGLAGAAVVTATLAGFGPGGMVGGLATLAALTGSAGAMGAAGVAIGPDSARRERVALASAEELAAGPKETIEVTLKAMIAVVHAQLALGLTSTEDHVRSVLDKALNAAASEALTHKEFAPDGSSAAAWIVKRDLFEKALQVLDAVPGSSGGDELAKARDLMDSGKVPRGGFRFRARLPQLPAVHTRRELPSGRDAPRALPPGNSEDEQ